VKRYDFSSSTDIIRVNKSKRIRWVGHVTGEVHTGFWWPHLRERRHVKNLGICGKIKLKWISLYGKWRALVNLVIKLWDA
jgi:hypothetical protein